MPRTKYEEWAPGPAAKATIANANAIIAEYAAQGFDLTLRQLYYQFVARDLLANKPENYDKLGEAINRARLAGLVDWDAITDRTRNLKELAHWASPQALLEEDAASFRINKWARQPRRVEVWIEKDALLGVIAGVCQQHDVPHFSCRGYTSQSEMWVAAQRVYTAAAAGQGTVILHLGDHDPSGVDMSRDIKDRLDKFFVVDWFNRVGRAGFTTGAAVMAHAEAQCKGAPLEIKRIALTMAQITEYAPPPNPAKLSDSRATKYIELWGDESWELDALSPPTLAALIRDEIQEVWDPKIWKEDRKYEEHERKRLKQIAARYDVAAKAAAAPGV